MKTSNLTIVFLLATGLAQATEYHVATDGRDENSATTVEDVAALCGENRVRIVAMSTGRRVENPKSCARKEYRRWDSNPHGVATTGF